MHIVGNGYFHIPYLANYSPPVWLDMRVERKICNLGLEIIFIWFWSKKQLLDHETAYTISIKSAGGSFIHSVHVPRRDAPRWLPQSINLINLPPRSQIMPPRSINE